MANATKNDTWDINVNPEETIEIETANTYIDRNIKVSAGGGFIPLGGINRKTDTDEGTYSLAYGTDNTVSGNGAIGFGNGVTASGANSFAAGITAVASNDGASAIGKMVIASGVGAHAEGDGTYGSGPVVAFGQGSHAEGTATKAFSIFSHAEGQGSIAGDQNNPTLAYGAHAEGYSTKALAYSSHAEGNQTIVASTAFSGHAEGDHTVASGTYSHAEGLGNGMDGGIASGSASHTEGTYCVASGESSHAEGKYTIANKEAQHVSGKYNIADSSTTSHAVIVGNGTQVTRSNAYTLDWEGNGWFAGEVSSNHTNIRDDGYVAGTNPSALRYSSMAFVDKNDVQTGVILNSKDTNGTNGLILQPRYGSAGSASNATLYVYSATDGSGFAGSSCEFQAGGNIQASGNVNLKYSNSFEDFSENVSIGMHIIDNDKKDLGVLGHQVKNNNSIVFLQARDPFKLLPVGSDHPMLTIQTGEKDMAASTADFYAPTFYENNTKLSDKYIQTLSIPNTFNPVQFLFKDTGTGIYIQSNGINYSWAGSSSDIKLKKNIKDTLTNGLNIINQIEMKSFDFIDEKYGKSQEIGYIAQQVENIVPEMVIDIPQNKEVFGFDSAKVVDDTKLIKYLVKAVQELSAEIEKLKNN